MCGIVGFIDASGTSSSTELTETIIPMRQSLAHRGPDDAGFWVDTAASVALGHRRLAVLDLSDAGRQPMSSQCGRYVIVFNGEIYNHRSLRKDLLVAPGTHPPEFRGHSDTEIILASFVRWGIEASLARFNGMFALAVWDAQNQEIVLARDRMGEKPLYYGVVNRVFLFASELKALERHPRFAAEVDREALGLYFRFGFVPAPWTIYKGIFKLPQACFLRVASTKVKRLLSPLPGSDAATGPKYYWSPFDKARENSESPFEGTYTEALDELDVLLRDAVGLRMEADVPLGAFLSGGIDSSLIVALMQAQRDRPTRTFSIGFLEENMNEAGHARRVARHLGTDHTELYVTPEEAREVIPVLPQLYDEPFADASQIPTLLVSRLAREHVTVSLSGDGGDELFCGYDRYHTCRNLWKTVCRVPLWLRQSAGGALERIPPEVLNFTLSWLAPVLDKYGRVRGSVGPNLLRLAGVLKLQTPEALYLAALSQWQEPARLMPGLREPETIYSVGAAWQGFDRYLQRMMFSDCLVYLPDDIMVKVDRASMWFSLEARAPFLDHRVVEFSWKIPVSMKVRNGHGKWLLRQLLYRYVPKILVNRPKKGFEVPLDVWLRGPLRDWAEMLLEESRLKSQGLLDPKLVRRTWSEHLRGSYNRQYMLWSVLMFQSWLDRRSSVSHANPAKRTNTLLPRMV